MYKLGPIDLIAFGLIPSQVDDGNMPLAGCWDMPARIGTTHRDWGQDEDGIEPYVRAEEIRLGGRDIVFVALLAAENENAALRKCYELYNQLGGLTVLVPFETDFGTWNVYLKDTVTADYVGDGWCKMKFVFREPIVESVAEIPAPTNAELGIDGISFTDFGLAILDVTGRFNRPAPKTFQSTYFENEGYKVSKLQSAEITIKALITQDNYTLFKSKLNALQSLFKREGLRYITYREDALREFFVKDGFSVTNVIQTNTGEVTGIVTVKCTQVRKHTDWSFLMDSTGELLLDALSQKIIVTDPVQEVNLPYVLELTHNIPTALPATTATLPVTVDSNAEWVVLDNLQWLTVNDSNGVGSGEFTISVAANTTSEQRVGEVKIVGANEVKTLSITQAAGAVANVLTVDVSTVSNAAAGGTTTITVTSNVAWTVSSNMPFVTLSKTGATGNSTFVLTVATNTTAFVRTAIVTIVGGGITRNISVQQQAASVVNTASLSNISKIIPKIGYDDELNLSAFVSAFDTPTYSDAGVIRTKWAIFARIGGSPFSTGIKPWKVGLTASKEYMYEPGPLVRGKGFVFPYNPDTAGDRWPGDIDPTTITSEYPAGIRYQDFTSDTDYWKLMDEQLNEQVAPDTLLAAYDMGKSASDLAQFGYANKVSGKSFAAGVFADVEINNSGSDAEKKAAINIGMAENTKALVAEMYSNPFEFSEILDINHNRNYKNYPDVNGNYPTGNSITDMWNVLNPIRISIPERNVVNKSMLDYANIIPTTEISSYYIDFAQEGSLYELSAGHSVTIRKFGENFSGTDANGFNVTSAFVRYATIAEIHSWYCINKLGRRGMIQGKRIGDKGPYAGLAEYVYDNAGNLVADTGASKVNMMSNRRYNAGFTLIDYMNGCHCYWWAFKMRNDSAYYNPARSQDGLFGSFAMLKMCWQSGGIDLFQQMNPLFWNTEYSLDGGTTWKKDKAIDLNRTKTNHLWVRSKVSSDGTKWELAAFRAEGVEPVSFMARYNGIVKTITADMWETTNPTYANTALANIPTADKEYFYQLYNM